MIAIAILVTFAAFGSACWYADTGDAFKKSKIDGCLHVFMTVVCLMPLVMYVAFCTWAQLQ